MQFSYSHLKELVPEIKSKKHLEKILNEKIFEVEEVKGDTIDISISPNRFSDASGHIGIAREISVALGVNYKEPQFKKLPDSKRGGAPIDVKDKKNCPRYMGGVFFNVNVGTTPYKIKKVLKSCGINSINSVVDILNYVMLETGQPMHAFDMDKLDGGVVVRKAKKGEKMKTLDRRAVVFSGDELVVADNKDILAIAGIKGGIKAEVTQKTKKIFVESASFESLSVYATSRKIGITTDASLRFARRLSHSLPEVGMSMARELLEKYADAKLTAWSDTHKLAFSKRVVAFNMDKFREFSGIEIKESEIIKILSSLGFKILTDKPKPITKEVLVEAPILRLDVEEFADVAEEVIRIYGFNNIKSVAPKILLSISKPDEIVDFSDRAKDMMTKIGFNEVYLSSFLPEGYANMYENLAKIETPPSARYEYLRPTLEPGFVEATELNLKHIDDVKIFEIGKTFLRKKKGGVKETTKLGFGISGGYKDDSILYIKGALIKLFKMLGITDWNFLPVEDDGPGNSKEKLKVIVGGKNIGLLKNISIGKNILGYGEVDLERLMEIEEGEYEYEEIPKFPASEKDISIEVSSNIRIGDIIEGISLVDLKIIRDVDLIDEYGEYNNEKGKISLTFRIVLQSNKKTLNEKEISDVIKKIYSVLENKFNAKIR